MPPKQHPSSYLEIEMATIDVNEADGLVLDWLIERCNGSIHHCFDPESPVGFFAMNRKATETEFGDEVLKREGVSMSSCGVLGAGFNAYKWSNNQLVAKVEYAPTAKVAGLRCHVFATLGQEVDVPSDLLRIAPLVKKMKSTGMKF